MIAGVLLALTAVQAGPPAPAEHRGQTVFLSWDAQAKSCVPQVDGVETGPVSTDDGKAALVAALRDKGATIRLAAKDGFSIPYDCTADIVATLRHAGFYGGIGFLVEPSGPAVPR